MIKGNSKDKNDGKETADRKSGEKEKKSSGLLSRILKEYPWPDKEDRECKERAQKETSIITQDDVDEEKLEDVASTVECPQCGKVFVGLDENGCFVKDFGRCEDFIGEGDDGDFHYEKGFDVLSGILSIYNDYIYGDTYKYISHLTGVNLKEKEDESYFLEEIGISITSNEWDGGAPGCSGNYAFLTVDHESQGDLLKKLEVIKNRLVTFEDGCGFNEFDPHKVIADLIDVYGTDIPVSDLLTFINYDPPPTGYLTTMLLINWLRRKDELSYASESFCPLNDYIFLKWLANGRQKEIMKSFEENITKDTQVAEVYEYLKKLSSQYVNEEPPSFGGPYCSVPQSRYKANKELFSGFYVVGSGTSKTDTPDNQNLPDKEKMRLHRLNEKLLKEKLKKTQSQQLESTIAKSKKSPKQ